MLIRTESDFDDIKNELMNGRLSSGSIRIGLFVFMIIPLVVIGVAYMAVAAENTNIGWENLSVFWQIIFKLELILFIVQLFLMFFVKGKSNLAQIILNIGFAFYAYKMVLDPFVLALMLAKDRFVYKEYLLIIIIVITLGVILHIYLTSRNIQQRKRSNLTIENKKDANIKRRSSYLSFFIIILLISLTGYIFNNDMLGEMDVLAFTGISSVVFFLAMIGTVEFLIGAYCVIRFPSFRVNPPTEDNHQ